jgi:hypothetical protein
MLPPAGMTPDVFGVCAKRKLSPGLFPGLSVQIGPGMSALIPICFVRNARR